MRPSHADDAGRAIHLAMGVPVCTGGFRSAVWCPQRCNHLSLHIHACNDMTICKAHSHARRCALIHAKHDHCTCTPAMHAFLSSRKAYPHVLNNLSVAVLARAVETAAITSLSRIMPVQKGRMSQSAATAPGASSSARPSSPPPAADEADFPFWVRSLPKQNLQGEPLDASVRKAFQKLCCHLLGHDEEPWAICQIDHDND